MDMTQKKREGSALVIILILVTVAGATVASFLKMVHQEHKLALHSFNFNATLNMAEMGLEEAMWALNNDNYTSWTVSGTEASRKFDRVDLGNAHLGETLVLIQDTTGNPTIYTEGRVILPDGTTLSKQIKVILESRKMFPLGLTAKDSITFSGGNATVDAYDCSSPLNSLNRDDSGSIGSISTSTDAVDIANASVFGYVATGGSQPDLGPQGKVYGADRVVEVEVHNDSSYFVDTDRIATDFNTNFDDVSQPTDSGLSIPSGSHVTIGDATGALTETYRVSDINIGNNKSLTVQGPVVIIVDGDVDVKGSLIISGNHASVTMYVSGDIDAGGNGIVNTPADPSMDAPQPEKMFIYGTAAAATGQTIKLHGNGNLAAAIYAPNAALELKGGGSSGAMYGAAVANTVKITGNYGFHYDLCLNDKLGGDTSLQMKEWTELISSSEKFSFASYFP